MTIQDDTSVIHRKARAVRGEHDARESLPARALRLSLCRAAERLFGLSITIGALIHRSVPSAAIKSELPDDGLLVLIDGADGARGAVQMDLQFLAALVEVQTTGRVNRSDVKPRAVTRTDAAIVAPLLDALLGGFDEELVKANVLRLETGLRFGDRVEDVRSLALMLDAPDYELFQVSADIANGAKSGELSLLLPKAAEAGEADGNSQGGPTGTAGLHESAMNAPVTLTAVLAKMSLPLRSVCRLEAGALLPIPPDSLAETELNGAQGHVVAQVKLGQLNGFRAVRLLASGETRAERSEPPTPEKSDMAVSNNLRDGRAVEGQETGAAARPPAGSVTNDADRGFANAVDPPDGGAEPSGSGPASGTDASPEQG